MEASIRSVRQASARGAPIFGKFHAHSLVARQFSDRPRNARTPVLFGIFGYGFCYSSPAFKKKSASVVLVKRHPRAKSARIISPVATFRAGQFRDALRARHGPRARARCPKNGLPGVEGATHERPRWPWTERAGSGAVEEHAGSLQPPGS